jgi:hypothetical protein
MAHSALERQGYRNRAGGASAQGVKLGPIGAQRVSAGLSRVEQKSKKPSFSVVPGVFNRPKKTARHQVVWSWRQENFLNYFKGKFPFKSAGPD